jgi:hypothetical protein
MAILLALPSFVVGEDTIQVQSVDSTSTRDVYIGTLLIAIKPNQQFTVRYLKNVISHQVSEGSDIDYRGYTVHTVSVLGYDDMEIGVITMSQQNGISDYNVVKLKAPSEEFSAFDDNAGKP